MARRDGTVYLLHFDRPYKHAKHYTGWTTDLNTRLADHAAGRGARLIEVIQEAGIGWQLARTWPGTRTRERQLKRQGGASRYCPHCGVIPRTKGGNTMVVQAANNRAVKKYQDFTAAIESVRIALEETDPLITAMRDSHGVRHQGWKVPDKKEVLTARRKVVELLDTLRTQAQKYEKELVANGWRV